MSRLSGNKTLSNIFLGAAVVLLILVVKYQGRLVLKTSESEHWDQRRYEKLKFTGSRRVIGLRQSGVAVSLDEWKLPGNDVRTKTWDVDAGVSLGSVKISPDLDYAAWPHGNSVEIRNLAHTGDGIQLPTQKGARPLDMGFLQGGSLVVLYSDGTMARWRVRDQNLLSTERIPVHAPDQMAADEDYVAAASSSEGKLVLYRSSDSAKVHVVEEVPCPPPPFEMVIPGQGQVALLTSGGIFLNGETLNTPGRVRSLAFGSHGELLAAGEFEGIYSVPKSEKAFQIAKTAANGVIAANEGYLVYSGSEGTSLFEFGSTFKVSPTGRTMLWATMGAIAVAMLIALDRLMFGIRRKTRHVKAKADSGAEHRFPAPPRDLVEAAASEQLVLWAGSGLSAGAGLPSRENFVRLVIDSGRFDHWINSKDAMKLGEMFERGDHEEAMDALVGERPELRNTVMGYVKGSYPRRGLLSNAHLALKRIPFAAAVTTNYDLLLEQLEGAWPHNVLHLKHNIERDLVRLDRFFLLKLYGDLLRPHTVLLSRAEMLKWFKEPGGVAPVVHRVLESATVLFVGCSLDGLLEDLTVLHRPRSPKGKYYALIAARDDGWKRGAADLRSKFGVEVMVCAEDAMHAALPEFLDSLAQQVEALAAEREAPSVSPTH